MSIKRFTKAIVTTSIVATTSLGINFLEALTPSVSVAQVNSCSTTRPVSPFSAVAASPGVNIRSSPSIRPDNIIGRIGSSERRIFDAWTYGDAVTDVWLKRPDARWYKLQGKIQGRDGWVASGVVNGNPSPAPSPLCPNNGGNSNNSNYANELISMSDARWNWVAGDNTRITGPMWGGEKDERNYPEHRAVLQVYNDLTKAILGDAFRCSAGYIQDPSYRNAADAGRIWGWHDGIDMDTPNHRLTDVKALVGGTIRVIQSTPGNQFLEIEGNDGRFYRYGHLSRVKVSSGRVNTGQIIGQVGISAASNHLHFQVTKTRNRRSGYDKFNQAHVYEWTLNPLKVFWQLKREGRV